jgi:antitoxin component YwqK of YwqJK toxin-antitoxin module
MNKLILCLLLLVCGRLSFAQTGQERIMYIIDSIPIIEDPKEGDNLSNEDVDNLEVVTNLTRIKDLGYEGKVDKVIYVTTKAYQQRSAADRLIPSTKVMVKTNGVWFTKGAATPYSGPFIDYFMSGKKEGEGTLKNGIIDGVRTVYYPNGNKRYLYTYTNGVENGPSEEYFNNGKIRQKGSFINKKETGLWQVFYSTGKLKRQSTFINNVQQIPQDEKKLYTLLDKGIKLLQEEDLSGAIKKFDESAKINPGYADIYLYRGTAKLRNFDFDNAVIDFDKAIEIEPLYMEAISNRAFARIRKYQFKGSRTLSKTSEVTILASKDKVSIPKEDLDKICADLNTVIDAIKEFCTQ